MQNFYATVGTNTHSLQLQSSKDYDILAADDCPPLSKPLVDWQKEQIAIINYTNRPVSSSSAFLGMCPCPSTLF